MNLRDRLLQRATEVTRGDIARNLVEPQRAIVTLLNNRSERLKDPDYQFEIWASEAEESGWA